MSNTNPYFGKRWELTITGPATSENQTQTAYTMSSDLSKGPGQDAMRVRFDVQTIWGQTWYWVADIEIWNPDEQFTNFLLTNGNTASKTLPASASNTVTGPAQQGLQVTLQAGYQSPGQYGTIWAGYVLQPMFDRINQTDFVVTLHCVIGLNEETRNSIGQWYPAAMSQQQIVAQMAKDAYYPLAVGLIAPTLANKSLSYPKVMFGNVSKYFGEIARDNNMQSFLGPRGLFNMASLNYDFHTTPKYTFTPQTGIVGTPQQTQGGVNCRLLLNPNVVVSNPPMAIKIDNTIIQQLQRTVGVVPSAFSMLSQSGTYVVISARYIGDTRGTAWYTDVTGWLTAIDRAALAAGSYFNSP